MFDRYNQNGTSSYVEDSFYYFTYCGVMNTQVICNFLISVKTGKSLRAIETFFTLYLYLCFNQYEELKASCLKVLEEIREMILTQRMPCLLNRNRCLECKCQNFCQDIW